MKYNYDEIIVAMVCGVISAFIDFYFIPNFLASGMPDYVWMSLMVILPFVVSVVIMKYCYPCHSKSIIWSMLTQVIVVIVFSSMISTALGYSLGSIDWYLFDWIAYGMFVFGWIGVVSIVQYFGLRILNGI